MLKEKQIDVNTCPLLLSSSLWEKHCMMLQRKAVYETIYLINGFLVNPFLPPPLPTPTQQISSKYPLICIQMC